MEVTTTPRDYTHRNVGISVREETNSLNSQRVVRNLVRFRKVVIEFQLAGAKQNLVRHCRTDDIR